MRAVLQRVKHASVTAESHTIGRIGLGWLVLLGVGAKDSPDDIDYLADKIINLRAFPDEDGKMNLTVRDIGGSIMIVSQFTLYADCRKGRRPGFSDAAPPEIANNLYEAFINTIRATGIPTATGQFQANMEVSLVNDGPVTLLLDSKKAF